MTPQWQDLKDKGFVVARGFLDAADLELLRRDYSTPDVTKAANGNYNVKNIALGVLAGIEPKLAAASAAVHAAAGIHTDMTTSGTYFATERGIDFPWHQDHESYFLFQEHYHYLNFYIPIVKPDLQRTNLSIVPFDRIRAAAPEYHDRLVGNGATRFELHNGVMSVAEDDSGSSYVLPANFDEFGISPELAAGDLLLIRGDMIHRTQDTLTHRVALSIRRQRSSTVVRKDRLLAGGPGKRNMMWQHIQMYSRVLQQFTQRATNELTVGELNPLVSDIIA